jgi:hypothetical protein
VVIGSNPILPLHAAAVAALDHQLLAIRPKRHANRRHQRPAGVRAIARPPQIDVAGGQAQGTVIAVAATRDRRSYEGAAAAALEGVALVGARPRAEGNILPRSLWPRPALASERVLRWWEHVVVDQIRQFLWRQAWHDRVLRSVLNDGQRGSNGTQSRSSQNTLQAHDTQHGRSRTGIDSGETKGSRCLNGEVG